jgi:hypothetical protein
VKFLLRTDLFRVAAREGGATLRCRPKGGSPANFAWSVVTEREYKRLPGLRVEYWLA